MHLHARPASIVLFCTIVIVFGLEIARGAVGNDVGLLALGALPDKGQLHGEYWRLLTFGFLHSNLIHILLNGALLLWVGPIVERRAGAAWFICVFLSASFVSGIGILAKHMVWPSEGASVGASGGLFGLLGAALVLSVTASGDKPQDAGRAHYDARLGISLFRCAGDQHDRAPQWVDGRRNRGALDATGQTILTSLALIPLVV